MIEGRRLYVFVSVYSYLPSLPAMLSPGEGQAGPKLSSSSVLPPGTVGLCWPWTGGSSLGFPGTVYLSF